LFIMMPPAWVSQFDGNRRRRTCACAGHAHDRIGWFDNGRLRTSCCAHDVHSLSV